MKRGRLRLAGFLLFGLGLLALALGLQPSAGPLDGAAPRVSFLALGDTGKLPHFPVILAAQRRVARAMVREDRRQPVEVTGRTPTSKRRSSASPVLRTAKRSSHVVSNSRTSP